MMIDALIWCLRFVFGVGVLGGSAAFCVRMIESGKNTRMLEQEKTKRQGMDNAWQLEQAKLSQPALGSGNGQRPSEITFELPGNERSWS